LIEIVEACDSGRPYVQAYQDSIAARSFAEAIKPILELDKTECQNTPLAQKGNNSMRFAIPLQDGKLCLHFGHCDVFALVDTDGDGGTIVRRTDVTPPPHEPGVLPKWLHEQGVNVILAGGMEPARSALFVQNDIKVSSRARSSRPKIW
jgi:predicted Fe-Mo cluster-binding NifX family protein